MVGWCPLVFPFIGSNPLNWPRKGWKEGPINFVNFIENMRGIGVKLKINYSEEIAMAKAICWAANYGKWREVDLFNKRNKNNDATQLC